MVWGFREQPAVYVWLWHEANSKYFLNNANDLRVRWYLQPAFICFAAFWLNLEIVLRYLVNALTSYIHVVLVFKCTLLYWMSPAAFGTVFLLLSITIPHGYLPRKTSGKLGGVGGHCTDLQNILASLEWNKTLKSENMSKCCFME